MQEVHIWEMGGKLSVKIKPEFLRRMLDEIKAKSKSMQLFYDQLPPLALTFPSFKQELKLSHKYFRDLDSLVAACNYLDIPLDELEKSVLAYMTRRGRIIVENPVLPVRITPVFDMLVAHHIGDGNVSRYKNRIDAFGYRQYNKVYRNLYFSKLRSLFGGINFRDPDRSDRELRAFCPPAVSYIFFSLYGLNNGSYLSATARIPEGLFQKNKEHKLAFLLGMIIDEGHVDSTLVVITVKNKSLSEDLYQLCCSLGYSATLRFDKNEDCRLYINKASLARLYEDYVLLRQEYPVVDLGFKGTQIEGILNRANKPKNYRPGNRSVILKLLEEQNLFVNQLAATLNMTRQGARFLIKELIKEQKVSLVGYGKWDEHIYGINNASRSDRWTVKGQEHAV